MAMQKRIWDYSGDMDVLGSGGTFLRHVGERRYHAIRFDNMGEHLSEAEMEADSVPTYHGSLVEVDLSVADIESAKSSWGQEDEDHEDVALAFMVASYGEFAPLSDEAGNNGYQIIRSLKRESRELEANSERYEAAMSRPVNALGATAREFQRGDMQSAMDRALRPSQPCVFGLLNPTGTVTGQVSVDMARTGSDDPLAFSYGFSQGLRGDSISGENDLASEYVRGHAEGLKVFNGEELPAYATR